MSELEQYRSCFAEIHAPAALLAEVQGMAETKPRRSHNSRRLLAMAAAAALLLALGAGAVAAGRSFFGWGNNMEIRATRTNSGVETIITVHTDSLTEPVIFENGRMIFIVNGEHIDITDEVSETRAYCYRYTDEEGVLHYWIVGKNGPEPELYGYAEYLRPPEETWTRGYVARTNNNTAPWLDNAKVELGLEP